MPWFISDPPSIAPGCPRHFGAGRNRACVRYHLVLGLGEHQPADPGPRRRAAALASIRPGSKRCWEITVSTTPGRAGRLDEPVGGGPAGDGSDRLPRPPGAFRPMAGADRRPRRAGRSATQNAHDRPTIRPGEQAGPGRGSAAQAAGGGESRGGPSRPRRSRPTSRAAGQGGDRGSVHGRDHPGYRRSRSRASLVPSDVTDPTLATRSAAPGAGGRATSGFLRISGCQRFFSFFSHSTEIQWRVNSPARQQAEHVP